MAEENAIWGVTDPAKQVRLEVTMIGDRPGGQRPHDCPVLQTSRAAMDCLGLELKRYTCSSTDANKPVSLGIPATCLSGGGAICRTHTVDEVLRRHPHRGRPQDGLPHGLHSRAPRA